MIYLALALLWLLHFLPLLVLDALGALLGELLFLLIAPRRRITLINMQRVFPDKSPSEQRALAREHFRHMASALLSQSILWWGSKQRIARLIQVEGEAYIDAYRDQPVILLAPHFVGLEWGAQLIAIKEMPGATLYRQQSSAILTRQLIKARTRFMPFRLFSRQDGIKPIIRALRDNLVLYYLPDQDFGPKDSLFVPFFGITAATVPAMSRLCGMTGAAVVPCVTQRIPGRGFKVSFYPAWENYPTDDAFADTLRMNQFIEERVLEMPAQYFWSHQRYKTRPEGEPEFY